jgi:hypothetical protein
MPKRQHQKSDSFPKEGCSGEKLPHLVFVHVNTNINTWFSALLTRVPCVGEYIMNQGETFKVVAVYHSLVMEDGKSRCGLHAILDVEVQPG